MSKFNSTRNAFDFAYSESEKGGFLSFTYFEIGAFLTAGVKGRYICIFFITCSLNFDKISDEDVLVTKTHLFVSIVFFFENYL